MGANAVTTVPVYTAGEVLTAADMNITNSGIPVFATTTTRDAAFGGAGEKTLAEGQFAYIEATNTTQYYDGAAWQAVGSVSKLVQQVNTQTGTVATGTTPIPFDNTIPQNTEGTQFMTLAITPTSASSILFIQVDVICSFNSNNTMTAALFQDATANSLAAAATYQTTGTGILTISFNHTMTAGTTSATTFKVRAGGESAGTLTFNGTSGGQIYGGVMASSITITELIP